MTLDPKTAEGDLAFMRALVENHDSDNRSFGTLYMTAGLLYGLQCLANGILLTDGFRAPPLVWMLIGWVPTLLFFIVMFTSVWRDRARPFGTGTTKRALNAAFMGAGISNLILALVFGWVAYQKRDWSIWLLFPVVVCALQGAVWFTAAILRRSLWQGLTATAWFISAAGLGLLVHTAQAYVLGLSLVLFVCMAIPGYIMMRSGSQKRLKA